MPPKAKAKAEKTSWTDKERLTYLFALIDNSNAKFDYNSTPRPQSRSVVACQRMIERLRGTLKSELEALQGGGAGKQSEVGKKSGVKRKRKVEVEVEGDGGDVEGKKGGYKGKMVGGDEEGVQGDDGDGDVDGKEEEEEEMNETKTKVKQEMRDEEDEEEEMKMEV